MLIDIVDVLILQLVAVVVDLVLDVERTVDVHAAAVGHQDLCHLLQRIVGQFKHLVEMVVLILGKLIFARTLSADDARHVVAGVTDRLQF